MKRSRDRSVHSSWPCLLATLLLAPGCVRETLVGDGEPPRVDGFFAGTEGRAGNPEYGDTVELAQAPPAISGGTLIILRNGKTAVAADPDRDQIYVVDADVAHATLYPRAKVSLSEHDEPGRLVEDGAGRVHVVLRRGGAIADLDVITGQLIDRRPVCSMPRGIEWDAGRGLLWVACAGGEVVGLPAAGGRPTVRFQIDDDLRDLVLTGGLLLISRFRSAEVLTVDVDRGVVVRRVKPAEWLNNDRKRPFAPAVAWRMIADRHGGALLVQQAGVQEPLVPDAGVGGGGYASGSGCGDGIVNTFIASAEGNVLAAIGGAALPVDLALANDERVGIVAAGHRSQPNASSAQLLSVTGGNGECVSPPVSLFRRDSQITAMAFLPDGNVILQSREPAALYLGGNETGIPPAILDGRSRRDTGHDVFHLTTRAGLACATCHPEGGDDGRTWLFAGSGHRRTPSLRGGAMERAPFHWGGELPSLADLLDDVMLVRMQGPVLSASTQHALGHYLDALPPLSPPPTDAAAVARGKAIFEDPGKARCASCHLGAQLTNHQLADVGTGGLFKVPSLRGLAARAPYLHDGSVPTLAARFAQRDDRHGSTSTLTALEIADLVAYLQSL